MFRQLSLGELTDILCFSTEFLDILFIRLVIRPTVITDKFGPGFIDFLSLGDYLGIY